MIRPLRAKKMDGYLLFNVYRKETKMKKRNKPFIEQLTDFLNRNSKDGCWIWTGEKVHTDELTGEKSTYFKMIYQIVIGNVPPGHVVVRDCKNLKCGRPTHLVLKTKTAFNREVAETRKPKSFHPQKTHCGKGHKLIPSNVEIVTYKRKGKEVTERRCKKCRNKKLK